MQELIRVSKALSDEVRVRMLRLLLEKDICVREMEQIFHLSQSQVSRNLKTLMDAGFLKRWREGKCIVYVANRNSDNQFCRALLDVLAKFRDENTLVSQDRKRLQQVIKRQIREKAQ